MKQPLLDDFIWIHTMDGSRWKCSKEGKDCPPISLKSGGICLLEFAVCGAHRLLEKGRTTSGEYCAALLEQLIEAIRAVSYTHLDVYKRQLSVHFTSILLRSSSTSSDYLILDRLL